MRKKKQFNYSCIVENIFAKQVNCIHVVSNVVPYLVHIWYYILCLIIQFMQRLLSTGKNTIKIYNI